MERDETTRKRVGALDGPLEIGAGWVRPALTERNETQFGYGTPTKARAHLTERPHWHDHVLRPRVR